MTKLTDTQLVVLSAAAARDDGSIHPLPENLRGGAVTKVVHALLKAGLIAEAAPKEGDPIGQTPFAITRQGLEAINADPDEGAQTLRDALGKLTVAQIATAIGTITGEAVGAKSFNYKTKALNRLAALMNERDLKVHDVLRAAGIEALTPDGEAVSGLGIAEPSPPPKPARKPRQTKQQVLIDMLQRDGGATMEQMVEATGWLAHTVRGAISGALRKKLGLTVTSEKIDGRGRVYRIEQ